MAFDSPFKGDPDFQYLALDRKKLMEEAPPYDAKTSCWVPDQREGFMRANIQATKGDEVTVLTEKGEVRGSVSLLSGISRSSSSSFICANNDI